MVLTDKQLTYQTEKSYMSSMSINDIYLTKQIVPIGFSGAKFLI